MKNIILLFVLTTFLCSCPDITEDCVDGTSNITSIDDLVKIVPLKTSYSVGEVITYKAELPSVINFSGKDIDVYQETNDNNARLYANPIFFNGNEVTYIKGSIESYNGGWTNVTYNPSTQKYELEVSIKLIKAGLYSMISNENFEFVGSEICNRFRIDSNIEGINADGKIEFIVQ